MFKDKEKEDLMVKVPFWLVNLLIFVYHSVPIMFALSAHELKDNLGFEINIAHFLSSIYFAGFTLGLMLFGRISDLQGRKKTMLIGIMIYIVSSFFLIISNSIYTLSIFKFLQAFGISVCSIVTQATSRDSYTEKDLIKLYSMTGILVCLIPTIETTIGGLIIENLSYRYCMVWDALKGFVLLICCAAFLPETLQEKTILNAKKIKFFSVFKKFVSDKKVIMYALLAGLSIGSMTGFVIEMPFLFIKSFNLKPSLYGLLNIIISLSLLIANFFNLYLINKQRNLKKYISYSLWISFISCTLLLITSSLIIHSSSTKSLIMVVFMQARILQGMAHVMLMPYVLSVALANYRGLFGSASSIFNGLYYIVISIITLIISYLHQESSVYAFALLSSIATLCIIFLFRQIDFTTRENKL